MPSRATLEKVAHRYLKELYEIEDESGELEVCEEIEEQQGPKTLAQSLQDEIDRGTIPKSFVESQVTNNALRSEMALFEATGTRGDSLEKLFLSLKNIAPTSVFSEQAFSIAGNLITKYRNRLGDQAIDDLCFEKGYLLKEGLLD